MKRRFRIILWTPGGFSAPIYMEARTSQRIRIRLRLKYGEAAAKRSSVTAICDVTPGLNPDVQVER